MKRSAVRNKITVMSEARKWFERTLLPQFLLGSSEPKNAAQTLLPL